MEYGGITPIGLPEGWRLLVDPRVLDVEVAVIGSGVRRSKLLHPRTARRRAAGRRGRRRAGRLRCAGWPWSSPRCCSRAAPTATARAPRPSLSPVAVDPHPEPAPDADRAAADRQAARRHAPVVARRRGRPDGGLDRQRHRRRDHADPDHLPRPALPHHAARHPPAADPVAVRARLPALPAAAARLRPPARHRHRHGRVRRDQRRRIPVEDSTDVAGRYTTARCLELAIAKVADLSWDDEVPFDGKVGDPGTLTLVVRPTGGPGPTLTIDTVSGTPVLAPVGTDVWRPDATIHGTDEPPRDRPAAQAQPLRRPRLPRVRRRDGVQDRAAPRRQAGPDHAADEHPRREERDRLRQGLLRRPRQSPAADRTLRVTVVTAKTIR